MTTTAPRIRLQSIHIENFRGIDQLDLPFPEPVMADDPDILVLGSANGGGKTSVLEACALAVSGLLLGDKWASVFEHLLKRNTSLLDYLLRSGADSAKVTTYITINQTNVERSVELFRSGGMKVLEPEQHESVRRLRRMMMRQWDQLSDERWLALWLGSDPDPLLVAPLLFFHGYRKVSEGNPELSMLADQAFHVRNKRRRYGSAPGWPMDGAGLFKFEALRCLMGKSGLFETGPEDSERVLDVLNRLMATYAGGRLEKLRPADDGSMELRVTPIDRKRPSYTFDALSSGQKEIISTLFLIWLHTNEQPGIVLLDEPELHFNVEWHTAFLRSLHELCPQNQYIIATHSRTIFGSVPPRYRVLLEPSLPGSVEPSV